MYLFFKFALASLMNLMRFIRANYWSVLHFYHWKALCLHIANLNVFILFLVKPNTRLWTREHVLRQSSAAVSGGSCHWTFIISCIDMFKTEKRSWTCLSKKLLFCNWWLWLVCRVLGLGSYMWITQSWRFRVCLSFLDLCCWESTGTYSFILNFRKEWCLCHHFW